METYVKKKKIYDKTVQYKDKFPDGLMRYCILFINDNKTIIQLQLEAQINPEIDMRYKYYQLLINKFLDTPFKDQSIYKSIRYMPLKEQILAVECLGHSLGMNPHNGNVHLLQIIEKFNMIS